MTHSPTDAIAAQPPPNEEHSETENPIRALQGFGQSVWLDDLRRSLYRVREELDTQHGLGVYLRRTDGPIGQYRRDKKDKSDKGKEALLICEWM